MAESRKRDPDWSPGDLQYATRLKSQKGGGGGWVYLTREHLAHATKGDKGRFDSVEVESLIAARTVLDPGTGQILIRLKKA